MGDITQSVGTQFVFADHDTDFVGGSAKTSLEQAGSTDVQMIFEGVADGGGMESDKFDFGANRAARYSVMGSIETVGATSGEPIDVYLAPSPDATAANGNPGQIDGVDTVAAPSGVGTLAELLRQCIYIGSLICEDTATTVQTGFIGEVSPPERYGILVVVNNSGAALETSPGVESHISMTEIMDEAA
jgi:hypothetical protein